MTHHPNSLMRPVFNISLQHVRSRAAISSCLLLAGLVAVSTPSASAQTRYWLSNGANTYNWSDTANWTGGNIPDTSSEGAAFGGNSTQGNTSQFFAGGNITVNQDLASVTVNQISVLTTTSNSSATLTLSGNAITLLANPAGVVANASTLINRGSGFAGNVVINNDLVWNNIGFMSSFANLTLNGNVSGNGTMVLGQGTSTTFNGVITNTGGLAFRGANGGSFQTGNFRAGNINVLSSLTGPMTWYGGVNATSTSGGVLSLLWTTGTGTISSALDFGNTDTSDLVAIQQSRGGTVEFTTNSITSGSGNRSIRLISSTNGSGNATIRFSGSGYDVTREIEFGGSSTSAGNTTSANSANVRLEFANTSGVQKFSGNFTNTSASTGNISIARTGVGGTTVLSGTQSIVAAIDVTGGTLIINGNGGSNTGAVTVGASGILGGTGTIGGATSVTGKLSAGDSTISNTVGTVTFNSTLNVASVSAGGLVFDLGASGTGNAGTTYDYVSVASTLTVGTLDSSDFTFNLLSGFGTGDYKLLSGGSIVATSIDTNAFTLGGLTANLSRVGNDIYLTVSAVPEPSTVAALAGVLVLGCAAYRRRRS